MASRFVKFIQCSLQTQSCKQIIPEHLSHKTVCLYHLTTQLSYSTSNSQQSSDKESIIKSNNEYQVEMENEKKPSHILLKEKGFLPIYKMQYAPLFSALNKVKWHQLYVVSGVVPLTMLTASFGFCPTIVPIAALYVGGVVSSTLWIFGSLFSRVVGAILLSPDGKTVCISYVDNRGRRKDDIFPVNDLVPLADLPYQKLTRSWWITLRRYETTDDECRTYKMFVQNYDITDKNRFMEVFGSLP